MRPRRPPSSRKPPTQNVRVAGATAKLSAKVAPILICATAAKASSHRQKKVRGELLRAREKRLARVCHSLEGVQTRWAHRPKARVTPKHRLAVCAPSGVPLR